MGKNAEFAGEIASRLAGEGNPVIVRINNGNYTAGGARFLSNSFAPAAVMFENKCGGKAFVFAGSPNTKYHISEAFSFLNYTRKQQLIDILKMSDEPLIYCPTDEEIYFRAATLESGELFAAVFNLSLDPMEKLEIVCSQTLTKIQELISDGTWRDISFEKIGERYVLDTPCNTLEPVILMMK